MTNEQREAVEKLKNGEKMDFITLVRTFKKEGTEKFAVVRKEYLDTVLSLIKEQQKKIEKYEKIYKEYDCYRWVKELNKKDKQIDLMAEMIDELSEYYTRYHRKNNEFCKEICIEKDIDCKDCIKQYFERKVEEC